MKQLPLPLVSIIIPCHNKADTIVRAIESIKVQTLNNLECFVILDRCSDNSLELVRQTIEDDKRFSYYEVDFGNVADTRNFGANKARGLFLNFLDGDDWEDKKFLEVCTKELLEDYSLGCTYTGLTSHEPDGTVQLSPGNPYWDYDRHINGQNTIWTCSVIRKKAWDRLGGQRSRYCGDKGAGAEDGEFYLRLGAYGWKAKKVTDEGLFHYSWKSGLVTGDPEYKEPDYRMWHPWTRTYSHPLASYATPKNRVSHAVAQYDEPIVSVIIPVGPGHEKDVIEALDSLEAQTFRKWEAIIVVDFEDKASPYGWIDRLKVAYPYVNDINSGGHGAGFARNRGVEIARAPLILPLDADDTLHPDALQKMVQYWNEYQMAVYTDYVGHVNIDEETAIKVQQADRLDSYNLKTGEAVIVYRRQEFNCKRALEEPTRLDTAYNWNLVTTLLPKVWFEEVGGFDEQMETLEDWDLWLRLAKSGHCFKHLPETLVRYRLHGGDRHVKLDSRIDRQKAQTVLKYIRNKHAKLEITNMGCGCGNNGQSANKSSEALMQAVGIATDGGDFVRARYIGRGGNHHIIGQYVFAEDPVTLFPGLQSKRKSGQGFVIYYGYDGHGYETTVHKQDVRLMSGKWEVLVELQPETVAIRKPVEAPRTTPAPVVIGQREPMPIEIDGETAMDRLAMRRAVAEEKTQIALRDSQARQEAVVADFDLTQLEGITPAIAERMRKIGLDNPAAIQKAGVEGLTIIKGIAQKRAEKILEQIT